MFRVPEDVPSGDEVKKSCPPDETKLIFFKITFTPYYLQFEKVPALRQKEKRSSENLFWTFHEAELWVN